MIDVANAFGSRLDKAFRAWAFAERRDQQRFEVFFSVGPTRHFATVQKLNGVGSPDGFAASRGDLVATVVGREDEFLGVANLGDRLQMRRHQVLKALRHTEQIAGRGVVVR